MGVIEVETCPLADIIETAVRDLGLARGRDDSGGEGKEEQGGRAQASLFRPMNFRMR
jgi:hypothetical protein